MFHRRVSASWFRIINFAFRMCARLLKTLQHLLLFKQLLALLVDLEASTLITLHRRLLILSLLTFHVFSLDLQQFSPATVVTVTA